MKSKNAYLLDLAQMRTAVALNWPWPNLDAAMVDLWAAPIRRNHH